MSREEAIEKLELMRQKVDEETYRALILAIKALEQEPTFDDECQKDMDEAWEQIQKKRKRIPVTLDLTPCDDAISRDMALEKMADYVGSGYADSAEDFEEYSRIICQLPPVTQKSGKWIKVKSGDKDFPESIVCSRCSNENSHLDFNKNAEPIGKVFVTSKFCPNCGAKMVEPQESEVKK